MGNKAEVAYQPSPEQKPLEQVIADDIRRVRDAFLNRPPDEQNAQTTYDPLMDIAVYQTLDKYRVTNYLAYYEAMSSLDKYTHFQLETMLGERFNVLQSEYILAVTPKGLYSPKYRGLILELMKRGRDYRRNQGSTSTDRESAEVEGMEKYTQPVLIDPQTPEGTSMLSISLRRNGSIYTKNFYDVFTVRGSGENRRIEVRRYSSALSSQDYVEKIPQFGVRYEIPNNPTDSYFLSHPIRINPTSLYSNPDKLHALFHKDHSYMTREDFEKILRSSDSLIDDYIKVLRNDSRNITKITEKFDAIINGADEAKEIFEERKRRERLIGAPIRNPLIDERIIFTAHDILRFERQKVRPEMTGCGILIGMKKGGGSMSSLDGILNTLRPQSVSDFGQDDPRDDPNLCRCGGKEPHFHCPGKEGKSCNNPIIVGKGITQCPSPSCGAGKVC